jgi:SAM-dependent methyltransferase
MARLAEFYASGNYHPPEVQKDVEKYIQFSNWYFKEKVSHAIANSGRLTGSVLEIGCGLGGNLLEFHKRGWKVYGVEPDARQAQFASQALQLPNIKHGLINDDYRLEEKVDLVYTNHAFEHFADLDSVMRAIARSLSPDGRVFTAIPTYFENRSILSKQWMNSAHYSLFTHRSLNQLFTRYGLSEIAHTYRGWTKEIDDLWHIAQYDGRPGNPEEFYEDSAKVQRYVNVYNPLRTVLYAPLYAGHSTRVALVRNFRRFQRSPGAFLRDIPRRFLARFKR